MQLTDSLTFTALVIGLLIGLLVILWLMISVYRWAKRNTKGAYIFLAVFPLISLFPIPPSATEHLDKSTREAKQAEQESGESDDNKTPTG